MTPGKYPRSEVKTEVEQGFLSPVSVGSKSGVPRQSSLAAETTPKRALALHGCEAFPGERALCSSQPALKVLA